MDESTNPTELFALFQAAKAGDKAAFEAVYKQLYLPVFRYILKRLGNTQDAEDITQTVFIKAFNSKTALSDQGVAPLAYFFTVARNAIIDHWRKNGRTETISLDESGFDPAHHTSLSQTIENNMTITQLLAQLTPEWQTVVRLRFVDGFETREVARRLGTTEMNVRQIQCRALRQLRRIGSEQK